MKTVFKLFVSILMLQSFMFATVSAETLAFSLPGVFQEAKDMIIQELENKSTTTLATVTKPVVKNVCEMFDSTYVNIFILDLSSDEAKQKIEKLEDTLEDESFLRDTIFGSVKNLLGLQKKEKIIFREMKKEISEAKKYYQKLDIFVTETVEFLDNNDCGEEVSKENSLELKNTHDDSEDLVFDEVTFKKQFASSLKDKMSIIQKEVKNAKK